MLYWLRNLLALKKNVDVGIIPESAVLFFYWYCVSKKLWKGAMNKHVSI